MGRLQDALRRKSSSDAMELARVLRQDYSADVAGMVAPAVEAAIERAMSQVMAAVERNREQMRSAVSSEVGEVAGRLDAELTNIRRSLSAEIERAAARLRPQVIEKRIEMPVERVVMEPAKAGNVEIRRNKAGRIDEIVTNGVCRKVQRDKDGLITGLRVS